MSARRNQSRKFQGDDEQQISMEFVFPQNRLKIMFALFLALFLILLIRIFYVQVIKADAIMALSKGENPSFLGGVSISLPTITLRAADTELGE